MSTLSTPSVVNPSEGMDAISRAVNPADGEAKRSSVFFPGRFLPQPVAGLCQSAPVKTLGRYIKGVIRARCLSIWTVSTIASV